MPHGWVRLKLAAEGRSERISGKASLRYYVSYVPLDLLPHFPSGAYTVQAVRDYAHRDCVSVLTEVH
jgi:hypothetical protein